MPVALDTSPRMAAIHTRLYRDAGAAKRAAIMAELSDALRELAITGVRRRHPEYADDEVIREVLSIFYGCARNSP